MPLEVTCGHCQGDILIESVGVTVACPLCGSHLEVPDPEAAIEVTEVPTSNADMPPADATAAVTGTIEESEATVGAAEPAPDAAWQPEGLPEAPAPAGLFEPPAEPPEFTVATEPEGSGERDAVAEAPTTIISHTAQEALAAAEPLPPGVPAPPVNATTPALAERTPIAATTAAPRTVPWNLFVLVASYASAVTLALLLLFYWMATRRDHPLESLPDLVPELQGGKVGMKVPKPQENVAPGHELRLGESQRYGNLKVTPVKITRGPIRFEHAFQTKGARREPSAPVLKLWLRFENVSADQVFPPLDRTIVYKRIPTKGKSKREFFTNNFFCEADERREDGRLHYVFDMPEFSEFLVVGQDLDHDVKPGEAWESFIPSEENVTDLAGDCVWRVQFRKGYHPESRRGVTTLIDVHFRTDEIVEEETPEAAGLHRGAIVESASIDSVRH